MTPADVSRLVLGTRNPHKLREIGRLLAPAGIAVVPLPEGVELPPEDGATFAENAVPKARAAAAASAPLAGRRDAGRLYRRRVVARRRGGADRAERGAECEPQRAEAASQRRFGVVINTGDAAAIQIEHGERFQHIVHFSRIEIQPGGLPRAQPSRTFEKADTVFVQDDLPYGKLRG